MHGKEFVLDCIRTFFTVVTLINLAMYIMGLYFFPDKQFGYEGLATPLIYGAAGTLPNLVMYSKRELRVGELVVRKVIQFLLIEVFVLFAAFYDEEEWWHRIDIVGSVTASIFVIYVVATAFDWLQNFLAAKQMTEDLKRFQDNLQDE